MKRLSRPAFLFVKSLRVSQLQPKIFAVCVQNTFEQYWLCPRIDKYPLQVECAISIRFWLAATSKLAGKYPQKTKTKETIVLVLIPHIGLFFVPSQATDSSSEEPISRPLVGKCEHTAEATFCPFLSLERQVHRHFSIGFRDFVTSFLLAFFEQLKARFRFNTIGQHHTKVSKEPTTKPRCVCSQRKRLVYA